MPTNTITIRTTAMDVATGRQQDATCNPVAWAIKREVGKAAMHAGWRGFDVRVDADTIRLWRSDSLNAHLDFEISMPTPPDVRRFLGEHNGSLLGAGRPRVRPPKAFGIPVPDEVWSRVFVPAYEPEAHDGGGMMGC